ncbi:ribosome maturation factor RimM [Canibacter sp. lx-72]|uniref:ribosome maturation factor RimM n=1 Tax=Canibacter zhuwentaonis TaxID=2837491 RepID=UPI001BDCB92A|nr:ribosome maturation factor RimM [Canibacter zhuwentaonis]MBT1017757.1 ribosome maturation factor RimM [Canibacter zhuwentaonis]
MSEKSRVLAPRPEIGAGSLRVARLTKPHGLKGALKLELYTDNPELRFTPGAVFYLQVPRDSVWFNKTITLTQLRWFNNVPVGFFDEISDRTVAESAARAILWIDEATINAGAEENAWYDTELVGLSVREGEKTLGTVESVEHLPSQDLLVVTTLDGATVLVPLVNEIVPEVNTAEGYVVVTPPGGLFETAADAAVGAGDTAGAQTACEQNTCGQEKSIAKATENADAQAKRAVEYASAIVDTAADAVAKTAD